MNFQTSLKPHTLWWAASVLSGLLLSGLNVLFAWGNWLPHWLLLVTLFWVILIPSRFSLVFALVLGLFLDSLLGNFLGFHGLLFALSAWLALFIAPTLAKEPMGRHLIQILVILGLYQFNVYWLYWWIQGEAYTLSTPWSLASSMLVWWMLWQGLRPRALRRVEAS
jgi:rod shape-determining protein MreD